MTITEFGVEVLNYGAIGLFCAYLIWQADKQQKREEKQQEALKVVIDNNTVALTKCYEEMKRDEDLDNKVTDEIMDLREQRRIQEEKKAAEIKK
jgi:hypothetical protein